jgi:hypothetical protein
LERELDAIANLPEKDFHPNTEEKVQDLIHPSMFPYIHKKSLVNTEGQQLVHEYKIPKKGPLP